MAKRIVSGASIACVLAVIVIGIVFGPELWHRYGDRLFSTERCTATAGGISDSLTAEQTDNAALIVAVGLARDVPDRALTVALATALQESDLRNLRVGDRDSLGLFQQRPSQGWGTEQEILDPHHATNSFYDALLAVSGWEEMSITEAAQAVQRSGFPEGYARHESRARLWAAVLSGTDSGDPLRCSLSTARSAPDSASAVLARVNSDFGATVVTRVASNGAPTIVGLVGDPRIAQALPSWAVAVASTLSVESVESDGRRWTRQSNEWETSPGCPVLSECAPGEVYLVLADDQTEAIA